MFGLIRPSASAAENVTSLKTEPGSYSWVTARLLDASLTGRYADRDDARVIWPPWSVQIGVGCVATRFAIERICPVLTSSTMAVPLTVFDD